MLASFCIFILLTLPWTVQANGSVIKLSPNETTLNFELLENREINSLNYNQETKQKAKLQFGSLKSNLGPIETKLQYNPFNQGAQVQAQMDLIESYQYFKENHDPRKFLIYTINSFRENTDNLKSNIRKNTTELYTELKKEWGAVNGEELLE